MTDKNRLTGRRSALIQYEGQVMAVIPAMLAEYRERWRPYIEQRDVFNKLFQQMKNSNANYPLGYMTNYYFRNFEHPTTPFYDGRYKFDEQNYHLLTEQEMMDLEQRFKVDEITAEVKQSIQEIRDYVSEVVAKNAPIRYLKGMEEFYSELVAIREESWCYSEDLASTMQPRGEFVTVEAHVGMGLRMPFHRELYVKLKPAYETFDILEAKLKRLKTVLVSISSDLAFSELRESTSEELAIGQAQLPKGRVQMANSLFDKMEFHPEIIKVSESLFKSHHYTQAIFEAFKAVNNFAKEKTGILSLDGKRLMGEVFNEKDPIIKLNEGRTQSDRDEQEGFKFLFMGAMVGIRNPKAHDNVVQTDPYRTLEYLGFASLLMKRIEEGEVTPH